MEYIIYRSDTELYHHGVKGMRWGVRRYQNEDGSFTRAGKKQFAQDKKTQYIKEGRSDAGGRAWNAVGLANSYNKSYLRATKAQKKIEAKIAEAKLVKDSKKETKLGKKWIAHQRSIRGAEYATKHLDALAESAYEIKRVSKGIAFVGTLIFGVPIGVATANAVAISMTRQDPNVKAADEYARVKAQDDYERWRRNN